MSNKEKPEVNESAIKQNVVLKGIAVELIKMAYPKISNLNDMLEPHGFKVVPIQKEIKHT